MKVLKTSWLAKPSRSGSADPLETSAIAAHFPFKFWLRPGRYPMLSQLPLEIFEVNRRAGYRRSEEVLFDAFGTIGEQI
jgi:hypothetical protein